MQTTGRWYNRHNIAGFQAILFGPRVRLGIPCRDRFRLGICCKDGGNAGRRTRPAVEINWEQRLSLQEARVPEQVSEGPAQSRVGGGACEAVSQGLKARDELVPTPIGAMAT
jgi:hypothetical protein